MNLIHTYPVILAVGAFVLALLGLSLLERGLFQLFAIAIDRKLRNLSSSVVWGWLQALWISLIIFSPKRSQERGLCAVQRGSLSIRQAGLLMAASYLPVLVMFGLFLLFSTAPAWPIIVFGMVLHLFLRNTAFLGVALASVGLGFLLLSVQTLIAAFSVMTTNQQYYDFIFFTADGRPFAVATLLLLSFAFALVPRTGFFSVVLALSGLTAGILSLAGSVALVFGELLGIGVVIFLMSLRKHKIGVKWYSVGAVVYPVLFWLATLVFLPGLSTYLKIIAAPLGAYLPAAPMGNMHVFLLWISAVLILMVLLGLVFAPLLQAVRFRIVERQPTAAEI